MYFLDSMLNMILVAACMAGSSGSDVTKFIQEYYQHIQVFLNQDTANDKMNARYLFRKLSCERIEDSLCLYIEDKQRAERQQKIKEELKRLELSGKNRRKPQAPEAKQKEQEKAEDDGVVWEQPEEEKQEKEIIMSDSILLEIFEDKELSEIVISKPVIFEKSMEGIEVLNINGRKQNPKAGSGQLLQRCHGAERKRKRIQWN